MEKFFLILFTLGLLSACSDTATNQEQEPVDETVEVTHQPISQTTSIQPNRSKRTSYKQYKDAATLERVNAFKTAYGNLYDKIMYITIVEDQIYFYVLKGKWEDSYWGEGQKTLKKGTYKMGLVNEQNEVLVPVEYDKIYNLGGTAVGLMEVEKAGKLGLYDLKGNALLEAIYDAIYPCPRMEGAWVQVKKGDQYGWLGKDGKVYFDGMTNTNIALFKAPTASETISHWNFDSRDFTLHPLLHWESLFFEDSNGSGAMLFTPSYLNQLDLVPEIQQDWLFDGGDFGNERTQAVIEENRAVGSGINALLTTFNEAFMDARGYQNESKDVVTVDEDMNVVDVLPIKINFHQKACSYDVTFQFVAHNVLEVRQAGTTDYQIYDWGMTYYRYYRIEANGEIEPMEIDGAFHFTRVLKITPDYFKGCFARDFTLEDEKRWNQDEGPFSYVQLEHLSIEDLDVMRNEIYAAHGYKFKSQKWQDYFSKKAWYRPKADNVDAALSEIEKHNIKVILAQKEKMEGQEADFIKEEAMIHVVAG